MHMGRSTSCFQTLLPRVPSYALTLLEFRFGGLSLGTKHVPKRERSVPEDGVNALSGPLSNAIG